MLAGMTDLKDELLAKLDQSRAVMLAKLEGLSDYDARRPVTPTGTNLLGLVKHLASMEYGYLGDCFGRPAPEPLPWVEDGSIWDGADMWARPEESGKYVVGLYRRACAHSNQTVAALDLESPGTVAHWPEDRRETTLGVLLLRMVAETAQHAGHADIVREMIDGSGGPDHDSDGWDADHWSTYLAQVQAAADAFKPEAAGPSAAG
jgi:hypothetical protein